MSEEPWYKDGLPFTCTQCGKCCTGTPGFVWVNDEEIRALAEFRGETVEEVTGLYTFMARRGRSLRDLADGDCVFYSKTEGCTVYPVRPRQCRTWPFWQSNVASPDTWKQTCAVCLGSGQGTLISAEEILERVKVIRL
jgi:Fe-S-cluster containining protein